jgi:hypothetical protein
MSRRLDSLVVEGRLSPVAVILGPRDQVNRRLYWTTDFEQWCKQICAYPDTHSLASIPEQLNIAFADFITGRPLSSGLARCDPPKGQGLWRLKTPDLRLYGWADAAQCMILAVGERKQVIAAPGYPKDRDLGRQAADIRTKLQLECVYGERYTIFPAAS